MKRPLLKAILILATGGILFVGPAVAQTAAPASGAGPHKVVPGHPRVNQVNHRQTKQQRRIANGIRNGSINPNEARRLERGEARIQRHEARDMAKNNGHLTKSEQRSLNRQENRQSRRIYNAKHNGK